MDTDSGVDEETINGDTPDVDRLAAKLDDSENGTRSGGGRIVELLQEERDGSSTPQPLGNSTSRYKSIPRIDDGSEDRSAEALPQRAASPIESIQSIPDDSPSVQVSRQALST